MATQNRLDRLFILLESGSSPVTRRAAAKQIGEVQKLHPHELHNLLTRLLVYVHSPVWDVSVLFSFLLLINVRAMILIICFDIYFTDTNCCRPSCRINFK